MEVSKNILDEIKEISDYILRNIRPTDNRTPEKLADDDFIEMDDRTKKQLEDDDYIELEPPAEESDAEESDIENIDLTNDWDPKKKQ